MNKADISMYTDTVFENDTTVLISAKQQTGFEKLLDCIMKNLPETSKRMKLWIPYDKTSFTNRIRTDGKIFSEEYTENGTLVDALVDVKLLKEAEEYKRKNMITKSIMEEINEKMASILKSLEKRCGAKLREE